MPGATTVAPRACTATLSSPCRSPRPAPRARVHGAPGPLAAATAVPANRWSQPPRVGVSKVADVDPDRAVAQLGDAVRVPEQCAVVADDHEHAAVGVDGLVQSGAVTTVEVVGRLVEKQHVRRIDEQPARGEQHRLPARQATVLSRPTCASPSRSSVARARASTSNAPTRISRCSAVTSPASTPHRAWRCVATPSTSSTGRSVCGGRCCGSRPTRPSARTRADRDATGTLVRVWRRPSAEVTTTSAHAARVAVTSATHVCGANQRRPEDGRIPHCAARRKRRRWSQRVGGDGEHADPPALRDARAGGRRCPVPTSGPARCHRPG